MDVMSPAQRSSMMSSVRSRNTRPEVAVRKAAHSMGLRFRLHRRALPGSPDVVFPRWRIALFVHGCFWHRHEGCVLAATPKTRPEFWSAKFSANEKRDSRVTSDLLRLGWEVEVIWECETRNAAILKERIRSIFHLAQSKHE